MYPAAGHIMTGNLKIISDSRIRYIVSKGPKYRFPSRIDFKKCREEIASALNDFGNRWCKREYVEPDALKEWKVSIFKIVDQRIKFHSQNTNLLPPKPKSTFRHLKQGIQDFHRKYVLVPADKAANNVTNLLGKTNISLTDPGVLKRFKDTDSPVCFSLTLTVFMGCYRPFPVQKH